ncbi:WSC domain-containing protein 2, partial [Durusdinium trenchii]
LRAAAVGTRFPRVVVCLQITSYVLLTVLTIGPLYALELWSIRGLDMRFDLLAQIGVDHGSNSSDLERFAQVLSSVDTDGKLIIVPKDALRPAQTPYDESEASHRDHYDAQKAAPQPEKVISPALANNQQHADKVSKAPIVTSPPQAAPVPSNSKSIQTSWKQILSKPEWVIVNSDGSLKSATKRDTNKRLHVMDGFGVDAESAKFAWFREAPNAASWVETERRVRSEISSLASEALARLRRHGVPCLPKACSQDIGFFDEMDDVAKVFLSSFPGSGNTWVRSILRMGTRKYTGSLYSDKKLGNRQGFLGEMLSPLDPKTSLIKSHFPMWKTGNPSKMRKFKSSIMVVRSPFDAILAELNRIFSGEKHKGVVAESVLTGEGMVRAGPLAEWFANTCRFWEGLNGYSHKSGTVSFFEGNGLRDFRGSRIRDMQGVFSFDIRPMRNGDGFPVFTMFYEDLTRNFVEALAHLFAYVRIVLGSNALPVYDALVCYADQLERAQVGPLRRPAATRANRL